MSQQSTIQAFSNYPVVVPFIMLEREQVEKIVKSCLVVGINVFEFINEGPKTMELVANVKGSFKEAQITIGVGNVMTEADAEAFIGAGAAFISSPCFIDAVSDECYQNKIPYLPGCMTIKEVYEAKQAGCEIIKVYPGELLGTSFVKAIKAVLPETKLVIAGGVLPTREGLHAWFSAGATTVTLGGGAIKPEWIETENYKEIENGLRQLMDHLH